MGLTVGIDIGGTKIAAGVVDEQAVFSPGTGWRPPPATPSRWRRRSRRSCWSCEEYDIEAVGIGAAGFVDEKRSRVNFAPQPGLEG